MQSHRLLVPGLVALMALGCLLLWLGVPFAWLWLGHGIESSGTRFVVTIVGCALTMVGVGWLLYRLEEIYVQLTGTERELSPPRWERSSRELGAPRPPLSLLETLLVASALTALIVLVLWWVFLADSPNPSGPLQPL